MSTTSIWKAKYVYPIINSNLTTGLVFNASKCEFTSKNFALIDKFSIFKDFKRVAAEDLVNRSWKEDLSTTL